MKPSDFIHPEDAAALRQMEGIPGFAALVKKILAIGIENLQYGVNMASCIRLSERQQRNDELKTHPCLIPYDELPESEKEYDRNTSIGTLN